MTRTFSMLQVDVFTEEALSGNPLAVFPQAGGLSDTEMQAIAREMNLSETTFVLPPEDPAADYGVRIFTPQSEIPFAGHPTIGTAHALLETGHAKGTGSFTLRQQTLAGVQTIDVETTGAERIYTMTQPTPTFVPAPARATLARALRVDEDRIAAEPLTVAVGVAWHIVPLVDLKTVSTLDPDMSALAELEASTGEIATTVFCREAADPSCEVRVRSFAPGSGIPEDPVCGSGNGCVGAYLAHTGLAPPPLDYRAEQGIEVGRPGRVAVRIEREGERYRVRVGGRAVTVLEGSLTLPAS